MSYPDYISKGGTSDHVWTNTLYITDACSKAISKAISASPINSPNTDPRHSSISGEVHAGDRCATKTSCMARLCRTRYRTRGSSQGKVPQGIC